MSDAWDDLKKAKEGEYFFKQNQEALKRIQARKESEKQQRLSPVTGEPMEQLTMMGVVVDRCPTTHGIWLDAGELEQMLKFDENEKDKDHGSSKPNPLSTFLSNLIKAE